MSEEKQIMISDDNRRWYRFYEMASEFPDKIKIRNGDLFDFYVRSKENKTQVFYDRERF